MKTRRTDVCVNDVEDKGPIMYVLSDASRARGLWIE
jgi:hypothetical protein